VAEKLGQLKNPLSTWELNLLPLACSMVPQRTMLCFLMIRMEILILRIRKHSFRISSLFTFDKHLLAADFLLTIARSFTEEKLIN
jgi:hypothetical protein